MTGDPDDDGDLQEKLHELELMFAARLPAKLLELRQMLASCRAEVPDRENLQTMYRLLHSLAGSAGIFGFHEMGKRAHDLELEFQRLFNQPDWPGAELALLVPELEAFFVWAETTPKGSPDSVAQTMGEAGEDLPLPPARLIFVAEQDPVLGEEIASQLEYFGFEVLLVQSLEQLEALMNSQLPMAMVIDLGFAHGKFIGADEIAALRADIQHAIPVIFVSQFSHFEARLAAVRFGNSSYLPKPVDLLALTDRLDAMTSQSEKEPYRILIVDDDTDSANYYSLVLRNAGMHIHVLNDPRQVLQALVEFHPELILMDIYMPDCNGVELAEIVRQDNSYLDVPIVFLSTEDDLGRQLEAIRSGADEFLSKPIKAEHLISAVRGRVERNRALRALIERDGLTGLYKHATSKDHLVREVGRARRAKLVMSLAMIDLDFFKTVNDRFGHPVGDQVLRALSRLLQQRLRRSDISGRYGGEEFMVIFPETSGRVACMVLDRIREVFAKVRHYADAIDFNATFSAGVAELADDQSADELIARADQLLYQAKASGRNCVRGMDAKGNALSAGIGQVKPGG